MPDGLTHAYVESPFHPGAWLCGRCLAAHAPGSGVGTRIADRATHDAWHSTQPPAAP